MTRVKICGIKSEEEIKYVNKYLPDYTGFVFAESKRQVTRSQAAKLAGKLNACIKRVGVFVNEDAENIAETAAICKLDIIQLHGDEAPDFLSLLKDKLASVGRYELWKAFRIRNSTSLELIEAYNADAFLLDSFSLDSYGGIGKTFDWQLAAEAVSQCRIILAGGLKPCNVKEAIRLVRPYAVDVSSGVESGGYKDEAKIRQFINEVRDMEGYND